ncbi:glycosyltransferase family 4 protein [Ureibacillus acetophenoni]|uniref:Glycosyltransferase involved in cell wall bisynthesis n=1 Tax=Ureibacillus acetophenoni TaxID=614649 RepID=A0A285UDP5_9BACL|nr:glycosyltransferase family 4 protein [Ureibacillus acetophenoni]SOC38421.1 glycosyltransferase involved in cell wall bisynthesis [Ureibacillus acetophenoni]
MKILHINSYYSNGIFYKNLYEKQKKYGLDIDVYVPISNAEKITDLNFGEYTTVSVNHQKYDRLLFYVKHKKILRDAIAKYNISNYSIIHAHSLFSNGYISMKLNEKYGIPYIVAVRNTDVNVFFKKMVHLRKLGVDILKHANRIIFLSESYRDQVIQNYVPNYLKDEFTKKIVIIPNGIDDFWINNRSNPKTLSSKKKINLLYVGEISKNKNIITTLKAIKLLNQKHFNIQFTAVGKILDKNVYYQIKSSPFANYLDPVGKEELIHIFRDNDIFVMPSILETFGLVYAEAMSQGLPVIYSRGQGFDRQFSEGEVGYSVEAKSVGEIADKIQKVIERYDDLSKNCIIQVDKFNWNRINNEYLDLYEEIVKRNV